MADVVERWARVEPFNPKSFKQVLAYLKEMGYKIPIDRKSRKQTSGEEALIKIATQHPEDIAIPKFIYARKLGKMIGYLYDTYLGVDGRMHPEFTFLPDTGRLSSRAPNFQNIPQGKYSAAERALALAIRRAVVPTPGHVLVELDWRGIEALLVAFFANDPDYARICEIDVHTYLASYMVGQPADISWPDDKLIAYLKGLRKQFPDKREICKLGNHADAYDIGVKHLAEELGSKELAEEFKLLRKTVFPKIAAWQEATRLQAHYGHQLMNPFGYTRAFWNVYQRGKPSRKYPEGKWGLGSEAWEALAFLPQSTGAAMCRQVILDLFDRAIPFIHLLVPIHDALFLEIEEAHLAEGVEIVRELMERPWPEMGGLRVFTDTKVGVNWGEMEEYK